MRPAIPNLAQPYLWEAEFEIERGRFGRAAALINEAKSLRTADSDELPERRQALLLMSVGRFAEAYKTALEGYRWDGRDARKLKVGAAMDLVVLGEITLEEGRFSDAIGILEKARDRAKNTSSLDGLEWVRAQNDIAVANVGLGATQAALVVAESALSAAETEWGMNSIPATDLIDTIGLIQGYQSDFKNAAISLAQSRIWRETTYGQSHPKVASSYMHAAVLSAAQTNNADALRFATHALEIEQSFAVGPNGRFALALLSGAEIFERIGETEKAKTCYQSALPVLERELGLDTPAW